MTETEQSKLDFPPVRACIFDMDGLLIDTEDIYSEVTNTILREFGRPELPWSVKYQLQGRPGAAAMDLFWKWAKLPISKEEYIAKSKKLQAELFPQCSPLPGVLRLLENLHSQGIQMALATSSNSANFKLKSSHLQHLFKYFPPDHQIIGGDDPRIAHGRGKPAPDIYLLALDLINKSQAAQGLPPVKPEECLVFEDAVTGVEAGRRAGMRVLWVPHPGLKDLFVDRVDEVLAGLSGQHEHDPVQSEAAKQGLLGTVGALGDGWGECRDTLVGFPWAKYGLKEPPKKA